jgi:hypothetical protein
MSHFSIWGRFGFRENPYDNRNLRPDEVGDALLVGRDAEVAEVQRKIASGGTHPSVEGVAGVGKSSLVAVAAYRMLRDTVAARDGTLFIPVPRFFQASTSPEALEREVYREVAQALIGNVEAFRVGGLAIPNIAQLDRWLNAPQYRSGGAQVLSIGGNYGSQANEAEGFAASGFPAAVRAELQRVFPGPGAGAIICVLDNLELLQTSADARQALEALRDTIFTIDGLRWVLCGSRGIVTHARSQRLSGVFDPPLVLGPLPDTEAIELIRRRIEFFGGDDAAAPVPPAAFEFLYQALHSNLRDALAYAQQFSDWLYATYPAQGRELPDEQDRGELLEVWLTEQADGAHAQSRLQPRAWRFFEDLAEAGGRCSASEWELYGFTTQQQMGTNVTSLVNANLVVREIDPENAARTHAIMTPQGWLVYFHRNRYNLPTT